MQSLELESAKKGFQRNTVTTDHYSCCIWTQDIKQGKNRVKDGNLFTRPTFRIFFHSLPQTRKLEAAVPFSWGCKETSERRHSNEKPQSAFFSQFRPSSGWRLSSYSPNPPLHSHSSTEPRIQPWHVEYMALVLLPRHSLLQVCLMAIKDAQSRMARGRTQSTQGWPKEKA